jgi:predicted ATP-dependent endonuclease of OLD family
VELVKVTVDGFKRFREKTHMYVTGKLIAIVGANEAGKSSFLKALVHANNENEFISSGGNQELSRKVNIADDKEIIKYHFYLNNEDKEELKEIPEAEKVNNFFVSKLANGDLIGSFEPHIERDISSRKNILKLLKQSNNNKKIIERFLKIIEEFKKNNQNLNIENLNDIIQKLDTDEESLSKDVLNLLDETYLIFERLTEEKNPKYIHELFDSLSALIENEKREVPEQEVRDILLNKVPEFMLFDDSARNLKPEYNLDDTNILLENSLQNLMATAKIDLRHLIEEIKKGNDGEVEEIIEAGNTQLKNKFKAWKQSSVFPRIKQDNNILKVLIGEKDGSASTYDDIAQRSDGLRQFMALFTFVNATPSTNNKPKILLIDEAETHLHYDAQADFIQMLTSQNLVEKVIYTTHSMGCLPEDLGMGIRFIEAVVDEKKSIINNWFWKDSSGNDKVGFSSILFGMGASTLAFIPLRNSLITEGPVDFILLPTLFREATEDNILGFQIVPGLSNASKEQIIKLDNQSSDTAYITDSDHGKSKLYRVLKDAGIDENRIFCLPEYNKNVGLAIEDIISKEIYHKVIQKEIEKYNPNSDIQIKSEDIHDNDRANAVDEFCKTNNMNPPSKREVAFSLLEEKANGKSILDQKYKDELSQIVKKIKEVFTD